MNLPKIYSWLAEEKAPKTIVEAMKLYGTLEVQGTGNSPIILGWAKELGLEKIYTADSIAWCGLFMAIVAKHAGKEPVKDPLWAFNWAHYGNKANMPMLGDTLVFERNGGGHVTIYVGEDTNYYHCLGGNQSDQVDVTRIAKSRLVAARRPIFEIAQPKEVRKILLGPEGPISLNEK